MVYDPGFLWLPFPPRSVNPARSRSRINSRTFRGLVRGYRRAFAGPTHNGRSGAFAAHGELVEHNDKGLGIPSAPARGHFCGAQLSDHAFSKPRCAWAKKALFCGDFL